MKFSFQTPSGMKQAWRLWRHCLCRFGWYPLLVAPFVAMGCILSLVSSADCRFMHVDVGFTPSNPAWEHPTIDVGLWFYQLDNSDRNNTLFTTTTRTYLPGCHRFTDDFETYFIGDDQMWNAARVAAIVSSCAGVLALVSLLLFYHLLFVFVPPYY